MPEQVFISYSHEDEQYLNELLTHLRPLERAGQVSKWSDQQIQPGSPWLAEIQAALAQAEVAVLLVSPAFLASDFIDEHELGPLLQSAAAGGVKILWVPVRASNYEDTPLQRLQAVWPPKQPLANMSEAERDVAWVQVCKAIKHALIPATANTAPANPTPPSRPGPANAHPALTVWREKLDFLLEQEAIAADSAQQFQLRKLIEEARQKIHSLGG